MSTDLTTSTPANTALAPVQIDGEKLELLKRTICKGSTNDELDLFVHACKRMGLDPFMRQIHAVKRWDREAGREVMSIQTGIDGYRLIAERTGRYMPGPKPTYTHNESGDLICATAFVKKLGPDNQWHMVDADAYFDEYAAFMKDGKPARMWREKPHIMLAKCAEALALRRAFPAELSGVYTREEMEQAENPAGIDPAAHRPTHVEPVATAEQVTELQELLTLVRLPEGTADGWLAKAGVEWFEDMPADVIAKCIAYLRKRMPTTTAAE